jgi:hypothetical protein
MSKPIKFRYYDKDIKAMLTPSCVGQFGFYENDRDFEDGKGRPLDQLMAFTGLVDNNGDEIYENDIVQFIGGTCHVLTDSNYHQHKLGAVLIVTYLPSGFTLMSPEVFKSDNNDIPNIVSNVGQYTFWNHQRSLVIIGNTHKDPELLS